MQESSTLYVGLDVHKDSIDIATAENARDGLIQHVGSITGDLAALDKSLRRLISRRGLLHFAHEAGGAAARRTVTETAYCQVCLH